jgi:hypothetical protein
VTGTDEKYIKYLVMFWRAWRWTSSVFLARMVTIFEHHWTTLVSFED